ncbi:MAG: alginate export family protein [Candidatus Omnitrophica bacterium]|nr:alginate export family protein [Candidatus Omnitrophota bacterium]
MGRKLIIALAILSFALMGTTFAAVENIKVSGDITTGAVSRDLTLGNKNANNTDPESDQFLFSQIRLRFDADLTEGVSATFRLINERIWGGATSGTISDNEVGQGNTDLNLDLAYVELKEFLYDPLTLVVGRQEIRFGNALIIGDVDTNRRASNSNVPVGLRDLSLRKSFDAVRGILDFAPWTVDLIYAKVEETAIAQDDDVTIIGANAAYDWSSYNGVTEIYGLYVGKTPGIDPATNDSESKIYVIGARAQADVTDKLTVGLESAYQFGNYNVAINQDRQLSAYAAQLIGEYRLLDDKNTKFGLNYTYLSGNNSTESNSAFNGWDPLFEDQSPGEVLNILFPNTNMQYLKASVSTMPREDVTLGLSYVYALLATDNAATTLAVANSSAAGSGTIRLNTNDGDDDRDIGGELDVFGIYDYTEDVQLSLVGGFFNPGKLFMDDNVAYSVRAGINVGF